MYTPKGKKIKVLRDKQPSEDVVSSTTGLPYEGDYMLNTATNSYTDLSGTIELEKTSEDTAASLDEVSIRPTRYDEVLKQQSVYELRYTKSPQPHTPVISTKEKEEGALVRYFAQHKQTGDIIEISSRTYSDLESKSTKYHHPSYLVGKTPWIIRGPVANQDVNGYIVRGSAEKNQDYIALLEKKLPNIRTYLTDPSQFVE